MAKFEGAEYKDLSDTTKTTFNSKLNQLKEANLTISEALQLTPLELGQTLGITPRKANYTDSDIEKTAKSYQRVYKQIRGSRERRENTIENVYDNTYKAGFTNNQKQDLKTKLTKTAGNTFNSISQELQDLYKLKDDKDYDPTLKTDEQTAKSGKRKADLIADKLLKINKNKRDILTDQEREILDKWS